MRKGLALLLTLLLVSTVQAQQAPLTPSTPSTPAAPAATSVPPAPVAPTAPSNAVAAKTVLENATPVKLRIARNVSSASAHTGETVDFEVLEEVKVGDLIVIPKGGIAWGTVTEAQSKRRMARGGKLDMTIDSVRLLSGEKAALSAVKQVKGGGHTGAMTGAIVATGLIVWPAAPFFLFMHGKDITIPKGTEITAYVNGDFPLDLAKFAPPSTPATGAQLASSAPTQPPSTQAVLEISSTPSGADIEVDGSFVGNTPSSVTVPSGEHEISISKSGYGVWKRTLKASTGTVKLSPELQLAETAPAK